MANVNPVIFVVTLNTQNIQHLHEAGIACLITESNTHSHFAAAIAIQNLQVLPRIVEANKIVYPITCKIYRSPALGFIQLSLR
jgi:hypothetical protein